MLHGRGRLLPVLVLLVLFLSALAGCTTQDGDNGNGKDPPTLRAKISMDKDDLNENETVEFSGQDSTGNIVDHQWEFGDGGEAEGDVASHTYVEVGEYRVTLTVISKGGDSHRDTAFVHVHHYEKQSDAISIYQEKGYVVPVKDHAQNIKVSITYPTGSVIAGQPSNDLDLELYYPNGTPYKSSNDQDPDTGNYQTEELVVPAQEIMASFFKNWKVMVNADTGIEVRYDLEIFVNY